MLSFQSSENTRKSNIFHQSVMAGYLLHLAWATASASSEVCDRFRAPLAGATHRCGDRGDQGADVHDDFRSGLPS